MRSRRPRSAHVTVTRDDVIFADVDGVVVVAEADVARVVEAARDIATREQAQAVRLMKGERLRDQLQLDELCRAAQQPTRHTRSAITSRRSAERLRFDVRLRSDGFW